MRKQLLCVAVAAGVLTLSGCSLFERNPLYGEEGLIRDRGQDYEQAQEAAGLTIPPHLREQSKPLRQMLEVPQVSELASERRAEQDFNAPRPEFFYPAPGSEAVNMAREGNERLIIVDEPIDQVWSKLRDFWKFNNIGVARSEAQQGVMVSDWIELDGEDYSLIDRWIKHLTFQSVDGPTRNKLRLSVQPVAEDQGRTAIRMQHAQYPLDEEVAEVNWQNASRDVGYKSEMMVELLRYLSKTNAGQNQQNLLSQQGKDSRPQLGHNSQGSPVLRIAAPIEAAWQQVNDALDKGQFDVGTRDAGTGIIYMTYVTTTSVEETDKMGFFEWLHSDRGDITLSTQAIGEALGVESDEKQADVKYSSQQTSAQSDTQAGATQDPQALENKPGYKIWLGGRVIYVFDSEDQTQGVLNEEAGVYEHTGQYQLHLKRTRNGTHVSVFTDQGVEAPAVVAEELLWSLKDNLPARVLN